MKVVATALLVLLLAAVVAGGLLAVGQIHHTNGCAQYGNALRGAVANPDGGTPYAADLRILSPTFRKTALKSVKVYQKTVNPSQTAWTAFTNGFVAQGLAVHGC